MEFLKMHGTGNDFIIIDNRSLQIDDKISLVKKICHRHFGVGADGCMFVEKSCLADIKMSFYNADGSSAAMCGNGIRCFSKYVFDKKIVDKKEFSVETGDGIKNIAVVKASPKESIIRVGMGTWESLLSKKQKEIDTQPIECDGIHFNMHCIHMGVPHGVIFVNDIENDHTIKYGKGIEKNSMFPEGINVNFVKVVDKKHLLVDTWERGAGKTLACGTGVCSSAIISHIKRNTENEVEVQVDGGILHIRIDDEGIVTMEGTATNICEGKAEIE